MEPDRFVSGAWKSATLDSGGYAYRPITGTAFAAGRIGGIRDLSYNAPTKNDENADIYSLELRYQWNNGITLRSLSGYQDKDIRNLYDTDGINGSTATTQRTRDQSVRERQWTEEVNLISPTGGVVDWVMGAYYQKNKIDVDIFDRVGTGFPTHIVIGTEKRTTGYFGQVNYHVTSAVELQLGLRYSEFEAESPAGTGVFIGVGNPVFPPGGLQVANLSGEHSDSKPTGKAAVNWKVSDDHLLYAFVARCYKPGGFNSTVSEFDPETVLDYEAGWKGTLLQGRMRMSVNVFRYDYKDFQTQAIDLSTGRNDVTNVSDATIQGIELETQAKLGAWRFDLGVAYVDSELSDLTLVNTRQLPGTGLGPQCAAGVSSNPPTCFNYTPFLQTNSGGVNLYAPELTFNAGIEYGFALPGGATLTLRVNYAYVDSQYANLLYNEVTDLLPSRALWSALLTYDVQSWSVQAYGLNLGNKEYVVGQNENNEFYGAPRQYGLRINYSF